MMTVPKRVVGWVVLLFAATTGASNAQVIEKKALTLDGARKVIAAAEAYAKQNNAPGGVIAVVDDGGNLMALERLDGTFSAGATISIGKARTAAMFKKPSKVFEDLINKGRTTMVALKDFTPLQGGIPIVVGGQIVGGVGVSGASSAQQDEELAISGAQAASEFKDENPLVHLLAPLAGQVPVHTATPSGMDSTTGETTGEFIEANWTMTLALPKTGLASGKAGQVVLADIGIPDKTLRRIGLAYVPPFGDRFRVFLSARASTSGLG